MANISTKINMLQLKNVVRELKGANGTMVKCLILPIKENNFLKEKKGFTWTFRQWKLKIRWETAKIPTW